MKLTIREFAESRGVSYESIRKQIKKHNDELEEHITIENGIKYLSDKAQDILNGYSKKSVVVLTDETAEIKKLQEDIKQRDNEIANLKTDYEEELKQKDQIIIELQQKYNADKEKYLVEKDRFINEKEKYLIAQSQLEQKNNDIKLIALNRKERRKYIKDLKKQAKAEKKAVAEQEKAENSQ